MAFEGTKYTGKQDVADIAKCVRKDIREAIKAGTLPAMKVSVRIDRFSMGRSLRVEIKETEAQVINAARTAWNMERPHDHTDLPMYSAEGQRIRKVLTDIICAYQRSDIDLQSDYFNVSFYEHIDFGWELEKAQKEAQQAALEAGEVLEGVDYFGDVESVQLASAQAAVEPESEAPAAVSVLAKGTQLALIGSALPVQLLLF